MDRYVRRSHFSCAGYQSKTSHWIFTIANSDSFFFFSFPNIQNHPLPFKPSNFKLKHSLYGSEVVWFRSLVSCFKQWHGDSWSSVSLFSEHIHTRSRQEQLVNRADIWKNASSFQRQFFLELSLYIQMFLLREIRFHFPWLMQDCSYQLCPFQPLH